MEVKLDKEIILVACSCGDGWIMGWGPERLAFPFDRSRGVEELPDGLYPQPKLKKHGGRAAV